MRAERAGKMWLEVHAPDERLVRKLADGERMDAGRREAVWDLKDQIGRKAPSGVYFVRAKIVPLGGKEAVVGTRLVMVR